MSDGHTRSCLYLEAGKPCEDWWGGGWRAQEFGTGARIGMSVTEAPWLRLSYEAAFYVAISRPQILMVS